MVEVGTDCPTICGTIKSWNDCWWLKERWLEFNVPKLLVQ